MVTPFDADGELNEDATRRLARHLVDHGSDGVVVAGTTGESPTLTDRRNSVCSNSSSTRSGSEATVMLGTGSNDTAHSVHLTREAGAAGRRRGRLS